MSHHTTCELQATDLGSVELPKNSQGQEVVPGPVSDRECECLACQRSTEGVLENNTIREYLQRTQCKGCMLVGKAMETFIKNTDTVYRDDYETEVGLVNDLSPENRDNSKGRDDLIDDRAGMFVLIPSREDMKGKGKAMAVQLCVDALLGKEWVGKEHPDTFTYNCRGAMVGGLRGCLPHRIYPELPSYMGSQTSITNARKMLDQCLAKHERCRKPSALRLPNRLIDLAGLDHTANPSELRVRLKETNREAPEYACVSYTWGSSRSIQLRTLSQVVDGISLDANYSQLMEDGICLTDLPLCLMQVILFAVGMGIQYLWIDALCIIQYGDAAEPQSEIQKMGDIYEGALITFAIAAAKNANDGFFRTIEKDYIGYPLDDPIFNGFPGLKIRRKLEQHMDRRGNICWLFQEPLPPHPLEERGWALQESLLSPRTLSFSASEWVWECVEWSTCQCQDGSYRAFLAPERSFLHSPDYDITLRLFAESWGGGAFGLWCWLVNNYARKKLTHEKDRADALVGIRDKFSLHFGEGYLAGLWKSELNDCLLWYVEDYEDHQREDQCPRTPSWSWLSACRKDGRAIQHVNQGRDGNSWGDSLHDLTLATDAKSAIVKASARTFKAVLGDDLCSLWLMEGIPYQIVELDFRPDYSLHGVGLEAMEVLDLLSLSYSNGIVMRRINSSIAEFERIGLFKLDQPSWHKLSGPIPSPVLSESYDFIIR